MPIQPASREIAQHGYGKPAKAVLLDAASNEVVFAVVGYVGSGTSEIATALKGLLEQEKLEGGKFDVEILKARKVILDWATRNGHEVPTTPANNLDTTGAFQDLGDRMRSAGDHAIVARELIQQIRLTRAQRLGIQNPGKEVVRPDGTRRAYILDSIRHPAEVDLLRHIYQGSFVLVGVVCDTKIRLQRITKNTATQELLMLKNLWLATREQRRNMASVCQTPFTWPISLSITPWIASLTEASPTKSGI